MVNLWRSSKSAAVKPADFMPFLDKPETKPKPQTVDEQKSLFAMIAAAAKGRK